METRFVFIALIRTIPQKRIKQLNKTEKSPTTNHRLLGEPNRRTNDFVEHPPGYASSRTVRKYYINNVALSPCTAKNFQVLAEQRVMKVADLCGPR